MQSWHCVSHKSVKTIGLRSDQLIPYRNADKWGFCDSNKVVVIPAKYTEVDVFNNGLAIVKNDTAECLINMQGKQIFPYYQTVRLSDDGRFIWASTKSYDDAIFRRNGQQLTKRWYKDISWFNAEGYAKVEDITKQGIIDTSGREIIPCIYRSIDLLPNGMVRVSDDKRKKGFLNLKTGFTIPCAYQKTYLFKEGLCMVKKNDLWGFIDSLGKEVIPCEYGKVIPEEVENAPTFNEGSFLNYRIDEFSEGLAVVVKNNKHGFIDKKGSVIVPFIFDRAYGFHNGFSWVKKGTKWGMINRNGIEMIPCVYDKPSTLWAKESIALDGISEGLIRITKDSLTGFVDSANNIVIPFKYHQASSFDKGLAGVHENKKWGFINKKGELVIPFEFDWIEGLNYYYENPFAKGYGIALKDKGWRLIDQAGKQLTTMDFDDTSDDVFFHKGGACVKAGGKSYIINEKGEIIFTDETGANLLLHTPNLVFDFGKDCFINIKTKMKYRD
jgi:hypothetical protein